MKTPVAITTIIVGAILMLAPIYNEHDFIFNQWIGGIGFLLVLVAIVSSLGREEIPVLNFMADKFKARRLHRAQLRAKPCAKCGYDLRATPECGTVPVAPGT